MVVQGTPSRKLRQLHAGREVEAITLKNRIWILMSQERNDYLIKINFIAIGKIGVIIQVK